MSHASRSGGFVLLLSALSVWSSAWADGRIEGQVSSSAGGAYLEGAVVRIAELNLEAVTRVDGGFVFASAPAGSYEMTVERIGFSPYKALIEVRDGETTRHGVVAVERTGKALGAKQTTSIAAALKQQRAADGIVSIVSATDIGRIADRNVAETPQIASAFDSPGRKLSANARASANPLQGAMSPKLALTYSDLFRLGARENNFGIAAAVSWFDRDFGSENIETDGGWFDDLEREDGVEFKGAKEIEQRDYVVNREGLGLATDLDYRPDGEGRWYLRTLFSSFSEQEYRTRNEFKFGKGDAIKGAEGFATWDGASLQKELRDRYEEREILSLSAGGEQTVNQWNLKYRVGYSKASEAAPDHRDTEFEIKNVELGYTSHGERPALFMAPATLDPAAYDLKEIVIQDNFTEDVEHSFKIDLRRDFDTQWMRGYLEAGAKIRRRERSNDIDVGVFGGFPGDPTLAMFALNSIDYSQGAFGRGVSGDAIDRFIGSGLAGFELNDADTLAASTGGDYDMNEDVEAVFIKNRLDIDALRIVYGVRYERTAFEAAGMRITHDDVGADGDPVAVPVPFAADYARLLPSINLRYAISDDLLLRAALSQTMARPKFGDLVPGGVVEFGGTSLKAKVGNPDLEPLRARNFDLSIEHYREGVGLLSARLYYKGLEDFVVMADTASITDFSQFVGNNRVDYAEIIQPINGNDAKLLGVELAWVQQLSNLPGALRNLLVSSNVTLTSGEATIPFRDEEIPMPRQADFVANFSLGYESDRLSVRVALAHKSERLIGLEELDDPAFDVYQAAHTQLDLGVKFFVNGRWEVYFDANNLSDEPYYAYFGEPRYNAQYETYGRTFALGIRYQP